VKIHFAARFSRPLTGHGVWHDDLVVPDDTTREGQAIGAYFEFAGDAPVVLGVGLSFVDAEHAAMNLAAEAPDLDFDAAQTRSRRVHAGSPCSPAPSSTAPASATSRCSTRPSTTP
jgi:putative alpha-1,2-mannosidase